MLHPLVEALIRVAPPLAHWPLLERVPGGVRDEMVLGLHESLVRLDLCTNRGHLCGVVHGGERSVERSVERSAERSAERSGERSANLAECSLCCDNARVQVDDVVGRILVLQQ